MKTLVKFPIETVRHSTAHLFSAAVCSIFPKAKFGIGPDTENGFYYDIKLPDDVVISNTILKKIKKRMKSMQEEKIPYIKKILPIDDGIELMKKLDQPFKIELLQLLKTKGSTTIYSEENSTPIKSTDKKTNFEDQKNEYDCKSELKTNDVFSAGVKEVSIYELGDFIDLCKGPHVEHSGQTGEFEFKEVAAAYWRGDANNDSLQRFYFFCYNTVEEIEKEKFRIEELKKNDHRTLGKPSCLSIFTMVPDEIGPGLPVWLPNGTLLRKELECLAIEEETNQGYHIVSTPQLAKEELYKRSGHLPMYESDMYSAIQIDAHKYRLRPMNCPHHHHIYKATPKSFRDLPFKVAEWGQVYRYEQSGVLSGLMRARGFMQNDAHIYCNSEQVETEFIKVIKMHEKYYKMFGITNFYMRLSLPGNDFKKYVSDEKQWNMAVEIIREAMKRSGLQYKEVKGEAAFYGPKIDFQAENVLGNEYTISTNQLDFLATSRFDLTYTGSDNKKYPVYVIHHAPLGSHERFIAFLIEHYAGKFPTWIAPKHVIILPISSEYNNYADEVGKLLNKQRVFNATHSIRFNVDTSRNTYGKKVANARNQAVPYILTVGKKEKMNSTVSVRIRNGDVFVMSVKYFIDRLIYEINSRVDLRMGFVD